MHSSNSLLSCISSSGHKISGGSTKTRPDVAPQIIADLQRSERCDIENLLEALLRRCAVSPSEPTAAPGYDTSTPRMPATENTPDGLPSSNATGSTDSTVRPEGSPNPNNESSTSESPTPLLQRCLEAVLPKCAHLKTDLNDLKHAGKEKQRCVPLVKLLNHALSLLNQVEPTGIRPASDLDVIFAVNDPHHIHWRLGSESSPDIVLLSLYAARKRHNMPVGGWAELSEECLTKLQRGDPWLEWPDVLAAAEVKWNASPIPADVPTKYETRLTCNVTQLPTNGDQSGPSEMTSRDTTHGSTSGVASSSTRSPKFTVSTDLSTQSNSGDDAVKPKVPDTTATAPRPAKRAHSDLESTILGSAAKKQRNQDLQTIKKDVVKQTGCNGAEMLHFSLGRRHALSLGIIDQHLWVWWCDRQGAIQTTGINFYQDLPHLLVRVLLLALQRFNLANWGFDVTLDPSILLRHSPETKEDPKAEENPTDEDPKGNGLASGGSSHKGENPAFSNPPQVTAKFVVNPNLTIRYESPVKDPLHAPFCLQGRATTGFGVANARDQAATPEQLVVKLYWPHPDRSKEEDIIQDAREVASDLENHLPRVVGSYDIGNAGTLAIRKELGIHANSPRASRVLRLIVFERLKPITELQGDAFLIALVECMMAHFVLWNSPKRIRHLDISLSNLMVRVKGNRLYGVLNDWDLSSEGKDEPGSDPTATIPFTALNLLVMMTTAKLKIHRLYYFEVESFFWAMIWTFFAYSGGALQPPEEMRAWQTCDPRVSGEKRLYFLDNFEIYETHAEWQPFLPMTEDAVQWVDNHRKLRGQDEREQNLGLLRDYLAIVRRKLGDNMPTSPAVKGL